jgi:hypothetical protein
MTLLVAPDALAERRASLRPDLEPLARSLRADLTPLLEQAELPIPAEKARLTRGGGRCPVHGVLLDFDPWSPRAHRCPVCGVVYTDDAHYRWWIMNYQLWLAERAVHAATLGALTGDVACLGLARRILGAYAERYLTYENKDNVLGPTRLFFSTYLESIWLLQLACALSLVESAGTDDRLGGQVRDRLMLPSVRVIAEYDEGTSNRQVWNNAALLAVAALLGDASLAERAVAGRSGIASHLTGSLLADGTWYEGENYHLFAHRGLWYGVQFCETLGIALPEAGLARFGEGFATPLLTALPDFTFPARRDSQYGVSLRQWRFAESCELGLARTGDARLAAALGHLYAGDAPERPTGRDRSTAEAERNLPAARLTRADLGWKSLLCASVRLVPGEELPPRSVHLPAQGFAVLRRDAGRVYVALDYGTPGGGHGHPDRLNAWLVVGDARLLEDVGAGSYVERTLFWYRSTLAHNAPLIDGHSQPYGSGRLEAWDERGAAGWIEASFALVPGRVRATRRLIVMPDYVIDELEWIGADVATIDLPFHVDPDAVPDRRWRAVSLPEPADEGGGFGFLHDVQRLDEPVRDAFTVRANGCVARAWTHCDQPHTWYRAVAPGPPGAAERAFIFVRSVAQSGLVRTVWSWNHEVTSVQVDGAGCLVQLGDERHLHQLVDGRWSITLHTHGARSSIDLDGRVASEQVDGEDQEDVVPAIPRHVLAPGRPFVMELGKRHYRRSEEPWEAAGAPEATLRIAANRASVDLDIEVRKKDPYFAPACAENPLDNEDPDINSDGVQLYVRLPDSHAYASWILVPVSGSHAVRVRARESAGSPLALESDWRPTPEGYRIRCRLPRGARGLGVDREFMANVVVNEMSADRERRRGQLVASGSGEEWVYLRGDREDTRRMLAFEIVDA